MLGNYIRVIIDSLLYLVPMAIIIYMVFSSLNLVLKLLLKREIKVKVKAIDVLVGFTWVLITVSILKITGVIGGAYGVTSLFDGTAILDFTFMQEGLSKATLLNIALFVPFGFFLPFVFKGFKNKWFYGIVFGFIFSVAIEFTQSFIGRIVQIDDVVMNTLGAFLGYIICVLGMKICTRVRAEIK